MSVDTHGLLCGLFAYSRTTCLMILGSFWACNGFSDHFYEYARKVAKIGVHCAYLWLI